jgi:hypothetical protein
MYAHMHSMSRRRSLLIPFDEAEESSASSSKRSLIVATPVRINVDDDRYSEVDPFVRTTGTGILVGSSAAPFPFQFYAANHRAPTAAR